MMQDYLLQDAEQQLSFSTIRTMIRVLNIELLKNPSLGNDLLLFLEERNIEIPVLSKEELNKQAPVSYEANKSPDKLLKLKRAFEGLNTIENIL